MAADVRHKFLSHFCTVIRRGPQARGAARAQQKRVCDFPWTHNRAVEGLKSGGDFRAGMQQFTCGIRRKNCAIVAQKCEGKKQLFERLGTGSATCK